VTYFLIVGSNHIFGTGEARNFKFGIHTDIDERMRDIFPQRGCVQGHYDLFKCCEMTDNISKTVQT